MIIPPDEFATPDVCAGIFCQSCSPCCQTGCKKAAQNAGASSTGTGSASGTLKP